MSLEAVMGVSAGSGADEKIQMAVELKALERDLAQLEKRSTNGEDVTRAIQLKQQKIQQVQTRIDAGSDTVTSVASNQNNQATQQIKSSQKAEQQAAGENIDSSQNVIATAKKNGVVDPTKLLDEYA